MRLSVIVYAQQASTDLHRAENPDRLVRWLVQHEDQADVIVLTECGSRAYRRALLRFVRGRGRWQLVHAPGLERGETAILARTAAPISRAWPLLTERTVGDRGRQHATLARIVVGGAPVDVYGVHLPRQGSGVRERLALARTRRDALTGLAEHVNPRLAAGRLVIVAGDFNEDHRDAITVARLRKRLTGLDPCWTRPLPELGTHGRRLIDAVWTNGRIVYARVKPLAAPSDHRPIRVVIEDLR